MARIIDLPEVPQPKPPKQVKLDMPKRDRSSVGCGCVMAIWIALCVVFITAMLVRGVIWAIGL